MEITLAPNSVWGWGVILAFPPAQETCLSAFPGLAQCLKHTESSVRDKRINLLNLLSKTSAFQSGEIPSKDRTVGAWESCLAEGSSIQSNKEPCSHGAKIPPPASIGLPGSVPEYLFGVIKALTHSLSFLSIQKLSCCSSSSKELVICRPCKDPLFWLIIKINYQQRSWFQDAKHFVCGGYMLRVGREREGGGEGLVVAPTHMHTCTWAPIPKLRS